MASRSERLRVANRLVEDVERLYNIGHVTNARVLPNNPNVFPLTTEDGSEFYLKLKSQGPDRVDFEHELLDHLSGQGIPVAPALETKKGKKIFRVRFGGPFALYPALPGKRLTSWRPAHLELYGRFLARLHEAMKTYSGARKKVVRSNILKSADEAAVIMLDRVRTPVMDLDRSLIRAVRREIARKFTRSAYRRLPKQLIHRDYHPWNIKLSGSAVVGMLDFEFAVREFRLFDLCYIGGAILSDDFTHAKKWAERFEVIARAFEETAPLTSLERSLMRATFLIIGILYVQFLLRQRNIQSALHTQSVLRWLYEECDAFE